MEILLIGAIACITGLLVTAWLMTFAKWFPIKGVDPLIVDYKTMIRGHVDWALMAVFGFGFYGVGIGNIEYSIFPCWCVAIGGFTNPSVFIIASFDPKFWEKTWVKIYTAISFILTTVGFTWLCYEIFMYALDKDALATPFGF